MREILFRGKRIDNDEWVYGFYTQVGEKYHCMLTGKLSIIGNITTFDHVSVIPSTVGQFTGLTDKNGKKIFEGDIVRRFNRKGQEITSYVVEWYSDCCMFVLDCIDFYMEFDTDFTVFFGDDFEIIGNIHDNTELLEVMTDA